MNFFPQSFRLGSSKHRVSFLIFHNWGKCAQVTYLMNDGTVYSYCFWVTPKSLTPVPGSSPQFSCYYEVGKSKIGSTWLLWFRGCCLATSGAPWVKFRTDPDTQRAKSVEEGQVTPHWEVVVLTGRTTYIGRLSWQPQDKEASTPAWEKCKSLCRGPIGVQSRFQFRWSQSHITLSKLHPWSDS